MKIKLTLLDLFAYLDKNNWKKAEVIRDAFQLWVNEKHPEFEIILPINESHVRFDSLSLDAVQQLAEAENVSFQALMKGIVEKTYDQIKLRVIAGDVKNGIIPFRDGLDMYESMYDLLRESSGKIQKFKNKTDHIQNFMNSIGMGQTEVGSYVITIDSPLYRVSVGDKQEDFISDSSLGRLVNMRLFKILKKMSEYLKSKSTEDELFLNLLSLELTPKTCDAVISLFGSQVHRDIEFDVHWSSKENISEYYSSSVGFSSKHASKIISFRDALSRRKKEIGFSLTGQIVNLHRDLKEKNGIARFKTKLYGRDVTVPFHVEDGKYSEVVNAHGKKYSVTVTGDLSSYLSRNRLFASFDEVSSIIIHENGELVFDL